MPAAPSLDIARLRARFLGRDLTAVALVDDVLSRIDAAGDDKVWIARVPATRLRAEAAALDAGARGPIETLPLFGIPFAVKDNIDVAGLDTTAACPAFAYAPATTAPAVAALQAAGAILIGKTNLDQFATGLVGTRSPYGTPRNPFDPRFIPGGSSSGSAVAVAAGLVSFALGTDTAGSGRVPAAFTNIVGFKPTRGRISARGVVPACRSLDCVSVFALDCEDAATIAEICSAYDADDPLARPLPAMSHSFAAPLRIAVPRAIDLEFYGDGEAASLYAAAAAALGGHKIEINFAPFREAAALLYGGPWVAERLEAAGELIRSKPESVLSVTRGIIAAGATFTASDVFDGLYRLAALRRTTEAIWREADVLLLPTAGTIYTIAAVEADPIRLNSNLGRYTNFVNLLDLAAVAVPAGFRRDGLPLGVSLVAPAGSDRALLALSAALQRRLDLPLGATPHRLPEAGTLPAPAARDRVEIAVVGVHLSGMALNGELTERGGRLVGPAATAPLYRLFLLPGEPQRPGLLRVGAGGHAIEIELWSLDIPAFGAFAASVPAPLSIGTIGLADGRTVKGFLCEAEATRSAEDISRYGGWRGFVAARGG